MTVDPRPDARATQRPMRLLYVVHAFPPDTWAGTEVYTLELALEMQRRGHQVVVVTRTPPEADEPDWSVREDQFSGLRVLRVTRRVEQLPLGESYRPLGARVVFEQLLDRLKPEVVHFQHLLHLSVEWIAVAKERGLATVYTANDYWALCARVQLQQTDGTRCPGNQGMGCFPCIKDKWPGLIAPARALLPLASPLIGLLDRVAPAGGRLARFTRSWIDLRERQAFMFAQLGAVDLTLAPSRFLGDLLLASGGFDPARLVHSDYGMRAPETPTTAAGREPGAGARFGFIGSLVEYKGIAVLLRAMGHLRDTNCRLEVFGDFHPGQNAYHEFLEQLAKGSAVSFRGRFDNDQLGQVFAGIDVLVVPSTWFENSPLVIHEAFLHRTPVVTSDIGGMAELVTDGVNGLHFPVAEEQALADCLRRFETQPDLLEELSRDFPEYKTPQQDAALVEQSYRALTGQIQ